MVEYVGSTDDKTVKTNAEAIWDVGQRHLPDMATVYSEATTAMDGIYFPGESLVTVEWTYLRDLMQTIFKNSSQNLEAAGTAVRTALTDLAETDEGSAVSIHISAAAAGDEEPEVPEPVAPE